MNIDVKLSKRLKKVASFIPEGSRFADIGSDHAYLPCYVCLNDPGAAAIAGEVNKGPFESACQTVNHFNLDSRIDVRHGDGLAVLKQGEADSLVIAGMGGSLITSILDEGKDRLDNVRKIIAQPNVDERQLRKWLLAFGYAITDEDILKENGHIYEIIVADKLKFNGASAQTLSEKQYLFGPILSERKSEVFFEKWEHEASKRRRVIADMQKARKQNLEKLLNFQQELSWIEEVLTDGNTDT